MAEKRGAERLKVASDAVLFDVAVCEPFVRHVRPLPQRVAVAHGSQRHYRAGVAPFERRGAARVAHDHDVAVEVAVKVAVAWRQPHFVAQVWASVLRVVADAVETAA